MIRKLLGFCVLLIALTTVLGCKQEREHATSIVVKDKTTAVTYASGFTISEGDGYTLLKVTGAFPGSDTAFNYALVSEKGAAEHLLESSEIDAVIQIPITSIVVTSTTHIPSLEMLGVIETLTGFPNLDYISSSLSRKRINAGNVKELGQNESLNTEVTIDLNPDAVVSFGVEGENKALESVQRAGIPVVYNGDWVEKDPLGKAEWIKFFGALYGKQKEADSIFKKIETDYLAAKQLASQVKKKPTILSGAMYKDVWYVANGESWQAKVIADAGGNYLWADTEGTGSIALSIESVLDKAQQADIWIAPGQFTSYKQLQESNPVYEQFDAFKNKKAFTFASQKGETGGVLYYELAPNRPDLVLKDLIYSLHPQLLPAYQPYFFTPLNE